MRWVDGGLSEEGDLEENRVGKCCVSSGRCSFPKLAVSSPLHLRQSMT